MSRGNDAIPTWSGFNYQGKIDGWENSLAMAENFPIKELQNCQGKM